MGGVVGKVLITPELCCVTTVTRLKSLQPSQWLCEAVRTVARAKCQRTSMLMLMFSRKCPPSQFSVLPELISNPPIKFGKSPTVECNTVAPATHFGGWHDIHRTIYSMYRANVDYSTLTFTARASTCSVTCSQYTVHNSSFQFRFQFSFKFLAYWLILHD